MASWPREVVCELIQLYELNSCLYAVGSLDYHNKMKKNNAYEEIARQISRLRPGTTAEDIRSKINGLRTQFMAEKGKIKKSQQNGSSSDEIHEPALWCYKLLEFLNPHLKKRNSTSNILPAHQSVDFSNEESQWVMLENTNENVASSVECEILTQPSTSIATPPSQSRKRKRELLHGEEFPNLIPQENECEVDAFGKFVAKSVKDIKKKSIRRRAMLELHHIIVKYQDQDEDEVEADAEEDFNGF
ncbi:uncharacterized protein [Periplaneta americana]|uniref:uncharacterized protein n=1 Tax=Periplaneta americana TaxID=6978 RepID=UPI0037E76E9E